MDNNTYRGTKLEFHIIQSFPVTCLNRDDVGSPKTAIVGGVTRARVSSQCWKRQIRMKMRELGVRCAVRTKNVEQKIAEHCVKRGMSEDDALAVSKDIAKIISDNTLHFFTESEADALAAYACEMHDQQKKIDAKKDAKEVLKIHKEHFDPAVDGFDIALFGRMVAKAKTDKIDLDIEAAAAFSHAITTHKASNEVEFFTAIDDFPSENDTGSSHLGSLEFNSGTYYRYVSVNIGQLYETLMGADDAMIKGLESFMKALYLAVPIARQATQAGFSPWDYARVYVRTGQQLQASFDEPVKTPRREGGGYSKPSIDALETFLKEKEDQSGSLFGKIAEFEIGRAENYSIDTLIADVRRTLEGLPE